MSKMVPTGKWCFSFQEDCGWDDYDEYNSPSDALDAAREAAPEYVNDEFMEPDEKADFLANGTVFVGQKYKFVPTVDADFVIERIQEEAYDEAGEYTEGYLDPPSMKDSEARKKWNAQIDDLTKRLTDVFHEWTKETSNESCFFLICDVSEEKLMGEGDARR